MNSLEGDLKNLIELMGFRDFSLNHDAEAGRVSLFVNENEISEKLLPMFLTSLDHVVRLLVKKKLGAESVFVDVNNYRHRREVIIIEMAKGAARKALATKEEVFLPAMNAYERRLIHVELASRPDVKTESVGEGRERYVVVRPIAEEKVEG
ncbi:hypothetical protein HYV91_02125 [Candidatus Wolfebacteria bacterium]|nr:hypothetical protein [Candidatus Wolfebacteria bacterium]